MTARLLQKHSVRDDSRPIASQLLTGQGSAPTLPNPLLRQKLKTQASLGTAVEVQAHMGSKLKSPSFHLPSDLYQALWQDTGQLQLCLWNSISAYFWWGHQTTSLASSLPITQHFPLTTSPPTSFHFWPDAIFSSFIYLLKYTTTSLYSALHRGWPVG